MKYQIIIFSIALLLCSPDTVNSNWVDSWSYGVGVGTRFHYSKSSLQLSPGPSLFLIGSPAPPWEIEAKFRFGSLFGYDFTGLISGRYVLKKKTWNPAIGVQFSCSGGFIPFHRDGPEYIIPYIPEWGIAIDIIPLRLCPGKITLSLFECSVGTDLRYPCRVLLLDATLLRFIIQLPGGKRG
jgi:hypothetical protein